MKATELCIANTNSGSLITVFDLLQLHSRVAHHLSAWIPWLAVLVR